MFFKIKLFKSLNKMVKEVLCVKIDVLASTHLTSAPHNDQGSPLVLAVYCQFFLFLYVFLYFFLLRFQDVRWGTVTLVDAERRLLGNALLDFSNERFVLLSESCIPIYNFPIIYNYLIGSSQSFLDSYDDPSRYGRGRYSQHMKPDIKLRDWRKGSQWFEIQRTLAIKIVSDTRYFIIRDTCHYPIKMQNWHNGRVGWVG